MYVEMMLESETDAQLALRFANNHRMREAFEAARGYPLAVTYEAARKASVPKQKAAPPKPAAPAPRAKYQAPAVSPERAARSERNRKVMASAVARGREDQAVDLIAESNLTADAILAKLAAAPTDDQVAAKLRQDAADAVWDKANKRIAG